METRDGHRLAAAASLTAAGLTFATTTNITIGLPQIAADLDASQSQVQFIQDVYMVVLGALVPPAGARSPCGRGAR